MVVFPVAGGIQESKPYSMTVGWGEWVQVPRVHSLYSRALGLDSIEILNSAVNAGVEGLSVGRYPAAPPGPPPLVTTKLVSR